MKQVILFTILFTITTQKTSFKRKPPHELTLTKSQLTTEYETNLISNDHGNTFSLTLPEDPILQGKNFYLQILSENIDNYLSVYKTENGQLSRKPEIILDVITSAGNIVMAMSDSYFNGKFSFFQQTRKLFFKVSTKNAGGPSKYTVKISIAIELELEMGKQYTTRVDYVIKNLPCVYTFNGKKLKEEGKNLTKLRFQANTILHKDDFNMDAILHDPMNGAQYLMNNIFKTINGGVLCSNRFQLCDKEDCRYKMELQLKGVKVVDVESFMVFDEMEILDINHVGEYYDRVYSDNVLTYYRMPYIPEMEGLDVNINLIPVTGDTGLYVNVQNKPLSLDKYDFKIEHKLSKRIVIPWTELEQMQAAGKDFIIAVKTGQKGEYMLKIDAHDNTFRGRLIPGTTEVGFIQYQDMANYLYTVYVYRTQEIEFRVSMQITSGDGHLFVKHCEAMDENCIVTKENTSSGDIQKDESQHQQKSIQHKFTCESKQEHQATACHFIIGIQGMEDHGTHFSLSIEQNKQHILMLPGNQTTLELNPTQERYLKFSYPNNKKGSLWLSVQPFWGEFNVYISKKEEFLSPTTAEAHFTYKRAKHGVYSGEKNMDLGKVINDSSVQGSYFILVKATTSSSMILKFYQRDETKIQIHSLSAGIQHRDTLSTSSEIKYYSINISLAKGKASTISLDLSPIKGHFYIYANRNGKMPTAERHEIMSTDDHIELQYENYEQHHEYLIGIQSSVEGSQNSEFQITLTYASKTVKLTPSVIHKFHSKETNQYQIQILPEMDDLLILKSIQDGYDINLCAKFGSGKQQESFMSCDESANEKQVSLFLQKQKLTENCKEFFSNGQPCYLMIKLSGSRLNQFYGIGYTYNEHPFTLAKNDIVFGPSVLKTDKRINFIYHPEEDKDISFYFNTKGRFNSIYTKKINDDQDDNEIDFPGPQDYSTDNQIKKGFITIISYQADEIRNGTKILLTVMPDSNHKSDDSRLSYDATRAFHLQAFRDTKQITRTEIHSEHIFDNMWNYYHLYNNGNEQELDVYVNSSISSFLEVQIARNKNVRIPFESKSIKKETGVDKVHLKLDKRELGGSIKGWYTVAIRAKLNCMVHIYWNNKRELNYSELTPTIPALLHLHYNKPLYFSFFAARRNTKKKKKSQGIITFHFKVEQKTTIYMTCNKNNEIVTPSGEEGGYYWKGTSGERGGISTIEILPEDENYCVECTYIGLVVTHRDQTISMMANIEHKSLPVKLTAGFTFPDNISSHAIKRYRYLNTDNKPFYLMIQTVSGDIQVYIGDTEKTGITKHIESYNFGNIKNNYIYKKIDPKNYKIGKSGDIYITVNNSKLDPASFILAIHKNNLTMPLEYGISKYLTLEGKESASMFFKKTSHLNDYELRLTLTNVEDAHTHKQAIDGLKDILKVVYNSSENSFDQVDLKPKKITISGNKIYYHLLLSAINDNASVQVVITNPLDKWCSYEVDLSQNDYKLVNLNETFYGVNENSDKQIFESYGIPGQYIFAEIKQCYGKVNLRFAEGDYKKIEDRKFEKYETLDDPNNAFIHFFRLQQSRRVFAELSNDKSEKSVYSFSMYNEQDLNKSQYSSITQLNDGRVQVLTNEKRIEFYPVQLNLDTSPNFVHQVEYTLYLSRNFKMMRFVKNCGKNKIEEVFSKKEVDALKVFKLSVDLATKEDMQLKNKLALAFENLDYHEKYYGVLVASIQMYPTTEGWWINPVREARSYYDEFVLFTAKEYHSYLGFASGIVISCVVFFIISVLMWNFVFGDLGNFQFDQLNKVSNLAEGVMGIDVIGILESEYEQQKQESESMGTQNVEIEMQDQNDHTAPLDDL